VSYEQIWEFIVSADIGVAFYKPIEYSAYLVALHNIGDYLMMGAPVVASDFPQRSDLVEGNGVGVCVEPCDAASVAEGIRHLLEGGDHWAAMSRKARELTEEEYNWDVQFADLYEVYAELAGQGVSRT
jgi:glycosyltransferase involved in cell wall biosynthesis